MRITGNAVVDRAILGRAERRSTYTQRMLALFGASIIGLWTQGEASGTVCRDASGDGRNGTYTGVQLAQPGVDRFTSARYDGATSYANVYSSSLATALNGTEGTLGIFAKIPAAAWSDGVLRYFARFAVAANSNEFSIQKAVGINSLTFQYFAGGVGRSPGVTVSTTNWFHAALTWSKSGDSVEAFVNGVPAGVLSGLGVWSGSLNSDRCCIGASIKTPSFVFSGSLQYAMLLNRAATSAEVAQMARAV